MDHQDDNEAEQLSWRADLKHSFDSGFFRSIKGGVRMTRRDATSIDTGYNWVAVIQPWMQWWALPGGEPLPGLDLDDQINSSLVHLNQFQNFYRGDANTPGAFYAPQLATALGFPGSYEAIHAAADPYYLCCYAGVYAPRDLADQTLSILRERNDRRCGPAAFRVGDNHRVTALHYGYDGVSGAQVDPDNLRH